MKYRVSTKPCLDYGILETQSRTTLPLTPNASLKPAAIDRESLKKSMYNSITVILACDQVQDCAKLISTLRNLARLPQSHEDLLKLIEIAINEQWKSLRHRLYKVT